jgi:hypothetical protein
MPELQSRRIVIDGPLFLCMGKLHMIKAALFSLDDFTVYTKS